jgi:hypothetical protein
VRFRAKTSPEPSLETLSSLNSCTRSVFLPAGLLDSGEVARVHSEGIARIRRVLDWYLLNPRAGLSLKRLRDPDLARAHQSCDWSGQRVSPLLVENSTASRCTRPRWSPRVSVIGWKNSAATSRDQSCVSSAKGPHTPAGRVY